MPPLIPTLLTTIHIHTLLCTVTSFSLYCLVQVFLWLQPHLISLLTRIYRPKGTNAYLMTLLILMITIVTIQNPDTFKLKGLNWVLKVCWFRGGHKGHIVGFGAKPRVH